MITSLNPVGEAARGQRWTLTVTAYLVASTVGGASVGGLLALAGAPATAVLRPTGVGVVLAVAALLGLVVDRAHGRVPSWRRQVDERWLDTYRGWVYGAGFGLQLGAGVVTIVPASITYVVLVCAALSGSPAAGAAIGATFGLTRAVPVLAVRHVRAPGTLRRLHRRVLAAEAPVRRLATAAQAIAAGVVVVAVVWP